MNLDKRTELILNEIEQSNQILKAQVLHLEQSIKFVDQRINSFELEIETNKKMIERLKSEGKN